VRSRPSRYAAFATVGAFGFVVQIGSLAVLMSVAHCGWLPATLISVELAVLHNFFWHERWTWSDQASAFVTPLALLHRLVRFHVGNGLTSLGAPG